MPNEIPSEFLNLLATTDGVLQLERDLCTRYSAAAVAEEYDKFWTWEKCGALLLQQNRALEALPILQGLYDRLLEYQDQTGIRSTWKATPLIWIAECHLQASRPALGQRYLMLALCEDAINCNGELPDDSGGVKFRLRRYWGLPDSEVQPYARKAFEYHQRHPGEALYPESTLQYLPEDWMTALPSPTESMLYYQNMRFVQRLLERVGTGGGEHLENLAGYLLSVMPGCRTSRRRRAHSTEYDLICSVQGFQTDFRSELGRYFVCECKDWEAPAGFTVVAKFCRVLDSVKCKFGILFSRAGISGAGRSKDAERELIKVFQDRGMVIVVVELEDLRLIGGGGNFISILREKYERVRLDLMDID